MPTSRFVTFVLCVSIPITAPALTVIDAGQNFPAPKSIKLASGAGRSRAGWTLGSAEESSSMRAVFKVNLRQCNIDRLEKEALAVSDLDSPRYGRHLSSREACELSSCPGRAEGVREVLEWVLGERGRREDGGSQWEEGEWLKPEGGGKDVMAKVFCSHVVVSMSAAAAADTFPEAAFRPHRRVFARPGTPPTFGPYSNGQTVGTAILRATGDILVPEALTRHVEFVSGLTELWEPDLVGTGAGRFGSFGGTETGEFTEVLLQPRTLRALYGVPDGERGDGAGHGYNRQGVASFDGSYLDADLCAAHNLLAADSDWLAAPEVMEHIDVERSSAKSVDIQYATLMGPGVPVTFVAKDAGEWILDWAFEAAEGGLTPENGGPLVWSISYALPEAWTCDIRHDACDGKEAAGLHGYDPYLYLRGVNIMLSKLVLQGVSVLVSTGDDGSGQTATCPVDPRLPVDVSGGTVDGAASSCPFESRDHCNCASFEMELLQAATNSSRCILPMGTVVAGLGVEAPGAECGEVLAAPDCVELLSRIENGTLPLAQPQQLHSGRATAGIGGGSGGGDGCQMAFSASNMSFYSTCACEDVTPMTYGACSLSGFSFQKEKDGPTPFAPRFPASSPWVTAVGATQIRWDLGGSCGQSDLLGPGRTRSAETAVNKFTGGFDGGGGFSNYFPAPSYQASHTAGYVTTKAAPRTGTFNSTNRGFPDISAAGHNLVAVVGGKVRQVGGTAASVSVLAGMVSLMNERLLAAGRPPLGFLNPALYKAAEESPASFQQILPKTYNFTGTTLEQTLGASYQIGSNKCSRYSCCEIGYGGSEAGTWDPVTGLGTINYRALSDFLNIPRGPPNPAPPQPGGGHGQHRTSHVMWIVVLVCGLLATTFFLVHEYRPKLVLSAATLGRSMGTGSADRGGGEYEGYERGGGGGSGVGRRSRGALTEMVVEREVGVVSGDAAYRLLEEDVDGGGYSGGERGREGRSGEERRGSGGSESEGIARRSV